MTPNSRIWEKINRQVLAPDHSPFTVHVSKRREGPTTIYYKDGISSKLAFEMSSRDHFCLSKASFEPMMNGYRL